MTASDVPFMAGAGGKQKQPANKHKLLPLHVRASPRFLFPPHPAADI